MIKILILCTGNSCRSQMAQGYLQSLSKNLDVHSAGTKPASMVNAFAIRVMEEVGINISDHEPKSVEKYFDKEWDYVITVCDEACPVFTGAVKHKLHLAFDDPARFIGTEEETLNEFRRIRDQIRNSFMTFYNEYLI